jgi:DNA-binding MarR family transcriptional regulator
MASAKKNRLEKKSEPKEARVALTRRLNEAMRNQSTQTIMLHTVLAMRLGLNATDHKALDFVVRHGQLTAGQIAEYTGLTTGAVTGVIDRLEKAGMARRHTDPNDRRRVVIEAVPEAVEKLEPLFAFLTQSMEELASQYSDADLELICTFAEQCIWITEQANLRLRET